MKPSISIVIPALNQYKLTMTAIVHLMGHTEGNFEIILIDNGSVPNTFVSADSRIRVVRNEKSIGVYPTFKQGFEEAKADVVAFFHSDLIVHENGWDFRVVKAFEEDPKLGMIGFVGSNEIDANGGRGAGTTSNFMGNTVRFDDGTSWTGSPAEAHGMRNTGLTNAAVVDGCAMIISRKAWDKIGYRTDFPPHHFYDRLISTQILEAGFRVAVLGIAFDHISGQTVNVEKDYQVMAHKWICENVKDMPWVNYDFNPEHNYDIDIYQLAEKMWLNEYRAKGFVPHRVK